MNNVPKLRALRFVLVGTLGVGCGSGSGGEAESCRQMAKVCGVETNPGEIRECVDGMSRLRKALGTDTTNRFLTCTRDAKSCPEIVGCAAGAGVMMESDFATGLSKMVGDSPGGGVGDAMPPECKQADKVCSPDEPFARDGCRDMVGNLMADKANLGELTACYARAKNCYAFKDCTHEMWVKLN